MLEIAGEVETNDEREMAYQLSGIVEKLDISSVRKNFKKALNYLEKTQTDEVLTKINEILNGKIGNTVFDMLDQGYITKPKTRDDLIEIIDVTIGVNGENASLTAVNVSNITDMEDLFNGIKFTGDISNWDVSNVENMSCMFCQSNFNGDISKWDVSKVTRMDGMFCQSNFDGDISKWDVSNVKNMDTMFSSSNFNGNISKWDVSNVKSMEDMFRLSDFNKDISNWNVSNVTSYDGIFDGCPLEDKLEFQPKFKD